MIYNYKIVKKILIVEDEKPISSALDVKLQKNGFETRIAHDGLEAEKLLEDETFDLILLDLMMPKKDGFAVLAYMQKRGNKTPVIVSTNLSQKEDIAKAKALGATDYFIKSNTPILEVVEYIKRILSL